ncbi:MAG: hypothetical protein EXQ47_05235 [Bryobacterales bacterium]|nr:hypothetical protein [Bryobacterales bacterium]
MRLAVVALLVVGSNGFAQQRDLNPMGGTGNILRPGIPLWGPSAAPGPGPGRRPQGGGQFGRGASAGFGGGAVFIPVPVGGAFGGGAPGYTVHNPRPGYYDPIFGGYTPPAYAPVQVYDDTPAPAPTPMVVINQNFQTDPVRPQFRDYSNVQLPEPGVTIAPPSSPAAQAAPAQATAIDDQPIMFLIALRDHTILPAVAYWVQGDTLNYITLQGAQNHVSVSLIDRDFSRQLNAESNVPFRLPAAQ